VTFNGLQSVISLKITTAVRTSSPTGFLKYF
jgi:hypothetical protein